MTQFDSAALCCSCSSSGAFQTQKARSLIPIKGGESVPLLWGHPCHAYKMSSALKRHRGGEAITALAIQHNGLLSPHHQSLSQSTPPTHTHTGKHSGAHKRSQTNAHAQTHTHTLEPHAVQYDRSLIMPLILSDSGVYNG